MNQVLLQHALLPSGWHENVLVTISDDGALNAVEPDSNRTDVLRITGWALPGMPNLHSHAHQRAMVGLAERSGKSTDSFWTWREVMYCQVERMSPDQLQAVAAQLYAEMLSAGYTSVAEFHYLHHQSDGTAYTQRAEMGLRIVEAARATGIGLTALPVLYRYGGFGSAPSSAGQRRFVNDADQFLDIVEQIRNSASNNPNIAVGVAPHSPRAIDKMLLDTVLAELDRVDPAAPIHIHVAEQQREVSECLTWCGRRPVQWLLDEFKVDHRWCLIHATHMDDGEVHRLAGSDAVAGLCPTTEGNLGDGLFEAVTFTNAGGVFGIGSDSHVSIDPREELRWLEYGQRLKHHGRNLLAGGPNRSTGRSLYDAALRGGGQSSGRRIGALREGFRADFVVLEPSAPVLAGRHSDSLLDTWLFSGVRPSVREVYVGGAKVVEAGRHIDADAIAHRYSAVMEQLSA